MENGGWKGPAQGADVRAGEVREIGVWRGERRGIQNADRRKQSGREPPKVKRYGHLRKYKTAEEEV